MPRLVFGLFAALVALSAAGPSAGADARIPSNAFDAPSWRLVGPHRAGWGTAVGGIAAQPDTFYFGAAGGGVWKTIDAGRTWQPIFDQGPASIGAIAIAPSRPEACSTSAPAR